VSGFQVVSVHSMEELDAIVQDVQIDQ